MNNENYKTCECEEVMKDVNLEDQARADREKERNNCESCVPMSYEQPPRSAVERSISEIAQSCNGALGELLNAVVQIASRENDMLQNDLKYWRESYFGSTDARDRAKAQRSYLLDVIDELRQNTAKWTEDFNSDGSIVLRKGAIFKIGKRLWRLTDLPKKEQGNDLWLLECTDDSGGISCDRYHNFTRSEMQWLYCAGALVGQSADGEGEPL